MSLTRLATRSALINILGSYGQQLLSFLATLALARLLAPEDFGTYGLALVVYMFFARARTLGLSHVYFTVPDPDDKDRAVQFWLSAGASLLVVTLVGAASPVLKLLYGGQVAQIVMLISIIALFETDGLASVSDTLLRRDLSYYRLATLAVLATGSSLVTTLLLATAGWKVWALVTGYGVKTLVYFAGTWAYAPRFRILSFDRERVRYFLKHAKNMWLGALGGFLAFSYDDIAVGTFSGTESLGYYRKAYDLSLLPLAFIGGAAEVMRPTYDKAREDRAGLTLAATTILDVVTKLVFPMGALLAIAAPEVIALYLGPQWLPAVPMLRALFVYTIVRPANDATGSLATVMGRTDVSRRYGIVLSVFMLVVCTALTLWMGAVGAALSAGMAVIVGFVIFYFGALRPFTDVRYGQVFIPPSLAVIAAGAASLLAAGQLRTESLVIRLTVKVAVFGVCYLGLLGALQGRLLIRKARFILDSLKAPASP